MNVLSKVKDAQKMMCGFWAIEKSYFDKVKSIYSNFEQNPKAFILDMQGAETQDILTFEDNTAIIDIKGPLVDEHNCATLFFGGCSYGDISAAIELVQENESIEQVIFNIDSPGGMVTGCDNAAVMIKNLNIPTVARVSDMAASAAFWLASQCDKIEALSLTASFGSIGVVIEYWDATRANNAAGFDKVVITSTGAPNKRVDALTDDGRKKIIEDLDAIEEIFVRRVAEGRKVSTSVVQANFGQGGMFLAEKSISRGMIDNINILGQNKAVEKKEKVTSLGELMKLSEALEQHPELKSEIEELKNNAVKSALDEKSENDKTLIDKASKYLDSSYPSSVKELAVKTIKGEVSFEALETTVTTLDALAEDKKSKEAANETEDQGETTAEIVNDNVVGGTVDDEESYQATVKRLKANK